MDDRPFLAEALFERLRADGVEHCVLTDGAEGEIDVAVPHEALPAIPASLARFCRAFDLRLVQLVRRERGAWQAVFAWSDEVGRPRFLAAELFADWQRAGLLLRAGELLTATPDVRFIHALLKQLTRNPAAELRGAALSALWQQDPRAAMEQVARFWKRPSDMRIVAQAAKHASWGEANRKLLHLRRAARRDLPGRLRGLAARLRLLAFDMLEPASAVIAFVGPHAEARESVRREVERELAPAFPAGFATVAHSTDEEHERIDLRIALDDGPASAAEAQSEILRWLECRVEQRHPEALVGRNPPAARLLQFLCRRDFGWISGFVQILLNCDVECRLQAPILMPHPYGIVIERGARIGNRVTLMQQATLARTDAGAPVIEDNVVVGPGARVTGPVRIGRGATLAANAVVTEDVPSHCTVVGVNQIAGRGEPQAVVAQRRADRISVVNS